MRTSTFELPKITARASFERLRRSATKTCLIATLDRSETLSVGVGYLFTVKLAYARQIDQSTSWRSHPQKVIQQVGEEGNTRALVCNCLCPTYRLYRMKLTLRMAAKQKRKRSGQDRLPLHPEVSQLGGQGLTNTIASWEFPQLDPLLEKKGMGRTLTLENLTLVR